jgi:hypothetical protein
MPMPRHPADIACAVRSRGRQAARDVRPARGRTVVGYDLHLSAALLRFHRFRAMRPIH